jgi:trehalose 6-phosphate phosphatase
VRDPGRALIALDFDGTLAPIVAKPWTARPHPAALPALRRLVTGVGTVAIISGRAALTVVELGGFADIPGLIVIGHHGWDRWEDGELASPPPPPGVASVRARLPAILADAGAPDGTWVEDKGHALVVHTRRTAEPQQALKTLTAPLTKLAAETGLEYGPGRLVIELRPPGIDKGAALSSLVAERSPAAVLFAGDDVGDLAAFAEVRALRDSGTPGLAVYSGSAETAGRLVAAADLVVDGPAGVTALLAGLADVVDNNPRRAQSEGT